MQPFVKVLRLADSGSSNLSPLCTGYFDVCELFRRIRDDAAAAVELDTHISHQLLSDMTFD